MQGLDSQNSGIAQRPNIITGDLLASRKKSSGMSQKPNMITAESLAERARRGGPDGSFDFDGGRTGFQKLDVLATAKASPSGSVVGGESGATRALEAKEQFLKMLVAQISNQSPTNPMDDKDMVSQLAQFSSIEQAIETNTKLEALEHAQTVATKLSVAALIGKQASASTGNVSVNKEGAPSPIAFDLDGRAKSVQVDVLDANDKVVRTIDLQSMGPGVHSIPWDGKGADKLPLPLGTYRPFVRAVDNNNVEVSVRHEIRGTIHRVDIEGDEPAVYVGDRRLSLREISQITD